MVRYPEVYLDDIVECQGNLFVLVVQLHYDLVSFINYYSRSQLKNYIDKGYAVYCTMNEQELFEYLVKKENLNTKVKKVNTNINEYMAEWVGSFYALAQWYAGVSSKELLKFVNPDLIIKKYNVLHDMDIKLAVKKWFERRGYKNDLFP